MIDNYCAWMAAHGRRPRTVEQIRKVLNHWADRVIDLAAATEGDVDGFVNRPDLKPATRRHYLACLSGLYRWAYLEGRVPCDPTLGMEKPKAPRYAPRPISSSDLARALAAADPRTALWLRLGAMAGLRCCEIAALRAEDVADGQLWVVGQKGGGIGCVPLHPALADALAAWPVKSGLLWPGVTAHYVSSRCNYVLHKSGSAATMHATRHAYGTNVYRASGGSLLVAQRLLRHASPATTAVYVAVADDALTAAVEAIPAA